MRIQKECVDKEGVKGLNSGDSNVSGLERWEQSIDWEDTDNEVGRQPEVCGALKVNGKKTLEVVKWDLRWRMDSEFSTGGHWYIDQSKFTRKIGSKPWNE